VAKLRGHRVLSNQTETLERPEGSLRRLDNRLRKLEQTQSTLQDKLSQASAARGKTAYELALNQFKLGNYQLSSRASRIHDNFGERLLPSAVLDRQRVLRDARLNPPSPHSKSGQALAGEFQGARCAAQHRESRGAGQSPRRARDAAHTRQEISSSARQSRRSSASRQKASSTADCSPAAVSLRSAVTASNPQRSPRR